MGNHYIELITWNRKMILMHSDKLTWTQKAIGLRSNGLHTEIRFSDRYGRISFSCTLADGAGCCRFKMVDYSHPYRQSRVRIYVTEDQESRLFDKACEMADIPGYVIKTNGDPWTCNLWNDEGYSKDYCYFGPDAIKYDKNGARFAFITQWDIFKMHRVKMICNEACANVMLVEWPDLLVADKYKGRLPDNLLDKKDPATLTPDQFEYLVEYYFYNKE